MTTTHGIGDPGIGARTQPLDVAAFAAFNAAQARTRFAYEDVKRRAAVPQSARSRRRKSRAKDRSQPRGGG